MISSARVLLLTAMLLVSANPAEQDSLIRANQLARQGQLQAAKESYAALAVSSTDPGLVAFNRGRLLYDLGDFRAAELDFQRACDDFTAPPPRRARAAYNWGVCRLQSGQTASDFRTAIACFQQALLLSDSDLTLQADARHNLELAKLFWAQSRQNEAKPPRASDPPDTAPRPNPARPDPPNSPRSQDPDASSTVNKTNQPAQRVAGAKPAQAERLTETSQKQPGPGGKPVLLDPERPEKLTREQALQLLNEAALRIARDRRSTARLVAGPDRPNVHDW